MSTPRISRLPSPLMRVSTTASITGTATRTRRGGLDLVQNLFVEARLARRHLQLGLAGDAIDGSRKREQHALIRRVHADEHGDAQHDAGGREHGPQDVLAEVGPADQRQENHVFTTCFVLRASCFVRCRSGAVLERSRAPDRFRSRDVLDDSSIAERNRSRATVSDLHVVRHDDDRRAEARVQIADEREDLVAGVRVEIPRRLVGEEDRRIDRQGAGDRDALALAARQLLGKVLQAMAELDEIQQLRARARRPCAAASRAGAAGGRRFRGTTASAAG